VAVARLTLIYGRRYALEVTLGREPRAESSCHFWLQYEISHIHLPPPTGKIYLRYGSWSGETQPQITLDSSYHPPRYARFPRGTTGAARDFDAKTTANSFFDRIRIYRSGLIQMPRANSLSCRIRPGGQTMKDQSRLFQLDL
jgi:hypothetical protein